MNTKIDLLRLVIEKIPPIQMMKCCVREEKNTESKSNKKLGRKSQSQPPPWEKLVQPADRTFRYGNKNWRF